MKYNNGLVLSTITLALLATGCVKKADNLAPAPAYDNSQVYNTAPAGEVYETGTPISYDTTTTVGTTYSEVPIDNSMITTTDTYGEVTNYGGATDYGQPNGSNSYDTSYGNTGNGAYGNGTENSYSNPYGNQAIENNYPASNYGTTSASSGGINLQIAALKDYYAAEEFKNTLSLDPKYSVYIKRGAMNKVIISGISSVSEANRLKERRFPGAFIVRGGGSSSSYSSSSSSYNSSASAYGSYTDNNNYGYNSSSSSSSSKNGIGVQIGAFSKRSTAQRVANNAGGRYQAIVKKVRSRGRTLYKVILTGFSSRSAAKRALSSGQIPNGFVTSTY